MTKGLKELHRLYDKHAYEDTGLSIQWYGKADHLMWCPCGASFSILYEGTVLKFTSQVRADWILQMLEVAVAKPKVYRALKRYVQDTVDKDKWNTISRRLLLCCK